MKEPLYWKLYKRLIWWIYGLTGHEWGCCNKVWKRCSKCGGK